MNTREFLSGCTNVAARPITPLVHVGRVASDAATENRPVDWSSVDRPNLLGSLVGGWIGYALWRKEHPVLGFLAGSAAGQVAVAFRRGDREDRVEALTCLGATAAGVGGSLYWKEHPAWGFVLGSLLGGVSLATMQPKSKEIA